MPRQNQIHVFLIALSVLLICSCEKRAIESNASKEATDPADTLSKHPQFTTPINIVETAAYGDGGTLYVRLVDAKDNEIVLCVSQNGFEGKVPHDTLFLDASHTYRQDARLPASKEEAAAVLNALTAAVKAAYPELQLATLENGGDALEQFWHAEFSKEGTKHRSIEAWNAMIALGALRRLKNRSSVAIKGLEATTPDWYEAYDVERRKKQAQQQREAELDLQFRGFYPETARSLFDMPDSDFAVEAHSIENDNQLGDDAEQKQGKLVAKVVADPVQLAVISCKAFGTIDDSWTYTIGRDRIATQAMLTVSPDDFAEALPKVIDDQRALLGAGRIFFYLRYGEKFSSSDWQEWGPKITEAVLTQGTDHNKPMVLRMLARTEHKGVVPLLRGIARGEIGKEPTDEEQWDQEPGLKESAYLALANRGDESIREEVQVLLKDEKLEQNQAALQVCLALLGDPSQIKPKHFKYRSYSIGFGALKAIERFEGKHGMDVLMASALDHPWAAVANEAMLIAQRITGQEWLPEGSNHQPRNFSNDAKAWWKKNGQSFLESPSEK